MGPTAELGPSSKDTSSDPAGHSACHTPIWPSKCVFHPSAAIKASVAAFHGVLLPVCAGMLVIMSVLNAVHDTKSVA